MKPKTLKSVKPRILELDGRELDEALEKIIADNPRKKNLFTEKDDLIVKKLYGRMTAKTIGESIARTESAVNSRINTLKQKGILK